MISLTKVRGVDAVAQVRSFNRTVTERVGALQDSFLARGRPLGASRVLWEIGDGADVRELRARLGLDSGYLSRLLRGLEDEGLIEMAPDPADRRVRRITRTDAGRAEVAELDRRSDALATALLAPLGEGQRRDLVEAMARVERLLTAGLVEVAVEPPASDAARFCLESYFAELNARFDAGFDPAVSVVADPAELTEPEGVLLVARLRGEPIGNGALRFHDGEWAEIKRMWVADRARGLGVGRRILAELEAYADRRGARVIRLETNRTLREAIALYRSAGYAEIGRFSPEPYAHHWFEKGLPS
jgi:DNA-binding MarR family transcriptional regulator/GNAT superfamily N-acetyltransferase